MKNRHSKKSHKSQNKKKKFFKKAPPKVTSKPIFPSISRIIPEFSHELGARKGESFASSLKRVIWNRYFLVSFISTFIGVAIALQGVTLTGYVRELQKIQSEREAVGKEIAYWNGVVEKHEDFRDGYFKLALLEYRLGNKQKAREYIDKTLLLDPNYKEALEFREKVEEK